MKKLLAMALALMLLLASAAFAENASLLNLSNMAVSFTADGQEQTIDLKDLNAQIAVGAPEQVPTIELDVDDGANALVNAVMQIVDSKVVFDLEGMAKPVAAAIPADSLAGLGEDPMAALAELFASLNQLQDVKMPVFTGVNIPKVPVTAVADYLPMLGIETGADGDATTFAIPWELLKQVFSMVTASIPVDASSELGPVLDTVNGVLQGDDGFELRGRVADDGETAELLIDLYPVSGSQTSDTAVGGLYFASAENADTLQVLLYQEGQSIPLGEINLASDPDAATLAFTANLMGEINFSFSLYPDETNEGCQVAAIELDADGETIAASVNYGTVDTMEFCDFAADFAGQAAFSVHVDSTPADDGTSTGSVLFYMQDSSDGQEVTFSADTVESYGDFDFRAIENVADAYDAENMSDADAQALNEDLENALAPLYEYLSTLDIAA